MASSRKFSFDACSPKNQIYAEKRQGGDCVVFGCIVNSFLCC